MGVVFHLDRELFDVERFARAYEALGIYLGDRNILEDWVRLHYSDGRTLELGDIVLKSRHHFVEVLYPGNAQNVIALLYTAFQCDRFEDAEYYEREMRCVEQPNENEGTWNGVPDDLKQPDFGE